MELCKPVIIFIHTYQVAAYGGFEALQEQVFVTDYFFGKYKKEII